MKSLAVLSAALFCARLLFAQGTIRFENRITGTLITYIYAPFPSMVYLERHGAGSADIPSGTTDWSGFTRIGANGTGGQYGAATTLAVLLAAPGANAPESSLQPATPTTSFRTGGAAGNVVGTTATLSNVLPDAPVATIQMVAWDNSSGLYPTYAQALAAWTGQTFPYIAMGKSAPFNVNNIGGQANEAPPLLGLESFNLWFPTPEPSSFALVGLGAAALLIFRRRKV